MNKQLKRWMIFLLMVLLSGCSERTVNEFSNLNLRWRREYPPTRAEYSTIVFSRKVRGAWVDAVSISGTHLEIDFKSEYRAWLNVFVLTTKSSRIVLRADEHAESASGELLKNLGIQVLERKRGILIELVN